MVFYFKLNFTSIDLFCESGLNRVDTGNIENFNEFGPSLPKRRFLQPLETDAVENSIASIENVRNRTVFKGYYAASPPALLGRLDRYDLFLSFYF